MDELNRLKCGAFTFHTITIICVFCIVCSCFLASIDTSIYQESNYNGCQESKCRCRGGLLCLCEKGMCSCKSMCRHKLETLAYMNSLHSEPSQTSELMLSQIESEMSLPPPEQPMLKAVPTEIEGFENSFTKAPLSFYKTKKFEMVSQDNQDGSPKNLLFGEGELLFTDEPEPMIHVFIMADLYVIGANLYSAKDQSEVTSLHYNAYMGDQSGLKFKLGELRRSLDGRYKLELKSKSKKFMDMMSEVSYIAIKLEDDKGTLRQTLLESHF